MQKIAGIGLVAGLVLAATPTTGRAEQIDPQRFDALLATARGYAEDRSLIFYCLRGNKEAVPFLYAGLHFDIEEAVQRLRAAGSDDRQNALLIQAVLSHVRFAGSRMRKIRCSTSNAWRRTWRRTSICCRAWACPLPSARPSMR